MKRGLEERTEARLALRRADDDLARRKQGPQPADEGVEQGSTCGVIPWTRLARQRVDDGDQIPGAVFHLAQKQFLLLLHAFSFGDVAGDLRGADHAAFPILDRRHSDRQIDEASVLALPDGLVVLQAVSASNFFQDRRLFVEPIGRNEDSDRPADGFSCTEAEEALRSLVPARDDPVEVFADDGVVGRFYDRYEALLQLFDALLVRNDFVPFVLGGAFIVSMDSAARAKPRGRRNLVKNKRFRANRSKQNALARLWQSNPMADTTPNF